MLAKKGNISLMISLLSCASHIDSPILDNYADRFIWRYITYLGAVTKIVSKKLTFSRV
jgi:hypothetical protein